ncbi:MAG: GNAT family N-acetyltransferase [Planctomycetales bacterium]|nr:GNAT family N-acetyltransferase [Planctomycetales bacterium]
MTYFRRFRMEIDLRSPLFTPPRLPPEYQLVSWTSGLIDAHAEAKFHSFCYEIDANVFPCLGELEGCVRLMREIARRDGFLHEATWLLTHDRGPDGLDYCGTVQGVRDSEFGAIQNLGITVPHRGHGLGTHLLHRALLGFREVGLGKAYLEVTAQNTGAVKLYHRLGFRRVKTVYKAADVAYA